MISYTYKLTVKRLNENLWRTGWDSYPQNGGSDGTGTRDLGTVTAENPVIRNPVPSTCDLLIKSQPLYQLNQRQWICKPIHNHPALAVRPTV